MRTCLILALAIGVLGAGLRVAMPVTPVDASFRDVVRFYRALGQPDRGSNTPETSVP